MDPRGGDLRGLTAVMIVRRRFLLGAAALAAAPGMAFAWPDRPLRIVVGFQAGGSSDVVARLLADRLRPHLGAGVIVENKPGASGGVAADAVMNAHDGHTLLILSDSYITASLTNTRLHFQPLRDFKPASLICEGTLVLLASARAPFRDFASFVAYVSAHPGAVNYVTAGLGGHQHLTAEYVSAALKLDMTHVPMRGSSQALQDLLAEQVELGVLGLGPTLIQIRAGKLFPLAVTSPKRSPHLPDVPTLAELGLTGFAASEWFGLAGPADTPQPVIDQLSQAVGTALDDEATRRRFDDIGFDARPSSPAELADKMRIEEARWRKLIAERGLKLE
jgi:tripartite-type tricarboxylate transporter receptor subunit TctC